MNTITKILIGVVATLIVVAGFLYKGYTKEKKERQRFESNYIASETGISQYTAKNGQLITEIQEKNEKIKEFEKLHPQYVKEIDNLNAQLKRTEWLLANSTKTEIIVKDTTIYLRDTVLLGYKEPKCVKIKDSWYYDMQFCVSDTLIVPGHTRIAMQDSTVTIATRIPKFEFWFIRIGTKSVNIKSTNMNPYVRTHYQEYIKLRRR